MFGIFWDSKGQVSGEGALFGIVWDSKGQVSGVEA